METRLFVKLLAGVALATTVAPGVFAEDGRNRDQWTAERQAAKAERRAERQANLGLSDFGQANQLNERKNRRFDNAPAPVFHQSSFNRSTVNDRRSHDDGRGIFDERHRDALRDVQREARRNGEIEQRINEEREREARRNAREAESLRSAQEAEARRNAREAEALRNAREAEALRNARQAEARRDMNRLNNRLQANTFRTFDRHKNWTQRKNYLRANIKRLNRLARLTAQQQQQLDAQMRAAWLAYHNNRWTGSYNWNYYSDPRFLDYLNDYQPSLLDRILAYLGFSGGDYWGGYYGSDDWYYEREELARNMNRIHELRLMGIISPWQEQQIMAQLRAEFLAYHNYSWYGPTDWSDFSDYGFLDHVYRTRPSLLSTVRTFIGM
ncbi:MAG TPA: hypothetical protein V6D17_24300 [Candidatus Obscuribacterales bacterium]